MIGEEITEGNEIYNRMQIKIIQSLNMQQISELIKIDSNYILPYSIEENGFNYIINKDDTEELCKNRCKEVFKQLYGEEKFLDLENCIDQIYEAQIKFQNNNNDSVFYDFRKPLESLKLLFNPKIIENNSPELIKKYYSELFNDESEIETFKEIILKTYGEKAIKFLNLREQLDVYAINSLEIFDEKILDNFSEEFVHDLLSYNIRNFSTFLNIIKNEDELVLFKEYYDMLSNVIGRNVETMQKAISEFYYNKELLANLNNKELTEEQYVSLISVLCGEKNQFNINTLEELERYDEIVKIDFQQKLNDEFDVKELILSNIFGMSLGQLEEFLQLYDLEEFEEMTEEEKEIINYLNFIINENDEKKLEQIAKELMNTKGIINPIALYSGIAKVKEYEFEYLKSRMLTKEKLDKICEEGNGEVSKEVIDGVEIYYFHDTNLSKLGLGVLSNYNAMAKGRDHMLYEGQGGMSTISTRMSHEFEYYCMRSDTDYYTDIDYEDLVTYNNYDTGTSHAPKLVKAKGTGNTKIKNEIEDNGEVAFYRRTRNHDKRKQDRPDGRKKIGFKVIERDCYDGTAGINKGLFNYAQKYNIPIVVLNPLTEQEKRIHQISKETGFSVEEIDEIFEGEVEEALLSEDFTLEAKKNIIQYAKRLQQISEEISKETEFSKDKIYLVAKDDAKLAQALLSDEYTFQVKKKIIIYAISSLKEEKVLENREGENRNNGEER